MPKNNQSGITQIIILMISFLVVAVSLYILGSNFLPKHPPSLWDLIKNNQAKSTPKLKGGTTSSSKTEVRKPATSSAAISEQHTITPAYQYISVIEYIKKRQPYPTPTSQNAQSSVTVYYSTPMPFANPTAQPSPNLSPSQTTDPTLSFSPTSGSYNKGCNFSLDINMDTGGKEVDGADVLAAFDPQKISFVSVSGVAKFNGNNIDVLGDSFNNNLGTFSFSALSSLGKPLNGSGKIASVNFSVKSSAISGTTDIKFHTDLQSDTTSNIIEYGTIQNILKKVVNGSYTISSGSCP